MRLATFISKNEQHAGIEENGLYYTFEVLFGSNGPKTVLSFIQMYENGKLPDFAEIKKTVEPILPDRICAPIPFPLRGAICVGKNYADHAKELEDTSISSNDGSAIPGKPVYFAKIASPVKGDNDIISLHNHFTKQVDYEVELAVIIGKTIKAIAPENVWDAIFGYTVINDITARDVQADYGQWFLGKSLDGFCSMGPAIVTKDEIPFPVELSIKCTVNGQCRQSSNTSQLIYNIPRIVSELSIGMTLYPGDIIATGTPGGVGHAKNPPTYLKKGDIVQCEIEKIGILTNTFE